MEESFLIKQILAGQRDKYAELVSMHQNKVFGLCLSILHNPVDAEEAAHDIFLKAFNALVKFRGDSKFTTWIYRIAVHHCNDLIRKRIRQRSDSWEELFRTQGDKIQTLFASRPSTTSSDEDKDLIERILALIKPESAQILILREVQGLSYDEMAQILGCSLDAIKARLKRARSEIQKKTRHFLNVENVKITEAQYES